METRVLIVMGVSGCGKSSIGQAIAQHFGGAFYEGDAYHSAENVAKMAAEIPLTDADRAPWLAKLRREIIEATPVGTFAVLACSALKLRYREQLRGSDADVHFLYLSGTYAEIHARMTARKNHFMKAGLLESQFATLAEPGPEEYGVITIPVNYSLAEITQQAILAIK